ncbi:DNA-binding MarR family transcriptional regulator [Arthrobacter sp. V4I6]|uniref:MarR family winged helix-turn-helix transcriptional regulator n=1 Tax=unclassified Arthrobacter TaxID=235627 RepID=UPI002786F988|nr:MULTISPECIES: MarR family transcriptional regulator [unclassified Arthrobacter]MDQ0821575.1 DNA-binding MarR family transcriptional regulator [Arthrobacter sp. V1I7]MDQ0855840.1 DNA-binding MarR family transcriptional regulator [Arthrobacter sp. V4I6]
MPQQASAEASLDLDAVSQWGLVIEGFQNTNKKLHKAVAAAFTLDPAEAETLLRLMRTPGHRMPMAALAREAAFSTGGVTKIADRLAKRNLAVRNPCADDRRVIYLELTDAGAEQAKELRCLVADIVQKTYIDVLGPDKAVMVAEAMAELREANAA